MTSEIGAGSVVVLDVAGSDDIVTAIRNRLGFGETRVIGIGFTHPEAATPTGRAMFFAPDRVADLIARVGAATFERDLDATARAFLTRFSGIYDVHQVTPDGLVRFWSDLAKGAADSSHLYGCVAKAG